MNFVRSIIFLSLLVPTLSFSQNKTFEKALKAYNKGNYREAIKYLDENLKKDPSSLHNILLKSDALYELKDFDSVVNLLRDLDDLDVDYRVTLSISLYETYQFDEAKEVFRSLLNEEEEEKDIVYCNMAASFYNMEIADSAIYFAEKAVELRPNDGMYRFNLGAAYELNDETDKACGQFFLASKLSYGEAGEFYETENCASWKDQWLNKLSGADRMVIENTMFPQIKDKVIVTHRTYLFEESGRVQQLKLIGLTELPVGAIFKFVDDEGRTIVRWSEKGNKDWTLKAAKRFDETSALH